PRPPRPTPLPYTTLFRSSCRLRPGTADSRIQVAVEHVHEEVAGEIERAEHEHARLHDRIVARADRLEDQSAEARPREHGLRDDRSEEHTSELQSPDHLVC